MISNIHMICSFITLSMVLDYNGVHSLPVSHTRALPQPKPTTFKSSQATFVPPSYQPENKLMDNMAFNIIMVSTVVILLAITLCLCAIKYRHKEHPIGRRRQNVSQESLLPNGLLISSDKLQPDKPPSYDVIIVDKNLKKPINFVLPPTYVEALHSTEVVKLPLPETHTHI